MATIASASFSAGQPAVAPAKCEETTGQRWGSLDSARFLAAVGVIWLHVCQLPEIVSGSAAGRFAVPFFSATAAYLLVGSLLRSKNQPSVRTFVTTKLGRLYPPFLAWSLIYVLLNTLHDWWVGGAIHGNQAATAANDPGRGLLFWGRDLWLFGGDYHLWFLPFILATSLLLYPVVCFSRKHPEQRLSLAMAAFLLGALLATVLSMTPEIDHPLAYMLMALPSLLWGSALAWLHRPASAEGISRTQRKSIANRSPASLSTSSLVGLLLLFSTALWSILQLGRSVFFESAAGTMILIVALHCPASLRFPRLAGWGRVSLGIYCSHLLFLKALQPLIGPPAWSNPWIGAIVVATLVTVFATSISLLLARSRATRWLVL